MSHRLVVLVNPNARKNRRSPERRERIRRIVGGEGDVIVTRDLAHLEDELDALVTGGFDGCLISDGGDGTLYWILNLLRKRLAAHGRPDVLPPVLPLNTGTVNFVARRVAIRGNAESILRRLLRRKRRGQLAFDGVESLIVAGVQRDADGREAPFETLGFGLALAGVGQQFFTEYYGQRLRSSPGILLILIRQILAMLGATRGLRWTPIPASWAAQRARFLHAEPVELVIDGEPAPLAAWRAINIGAFPLDLSKILQVFGLAGDGKLHLIAGCPTPFELVHSILRMSIGRDVRAETMISRCVTELVARAGDPGGMTPILDGERLNGVVEARVTPGPPIRIPRLR